MEHHLVRLTIRFCILCILPLRRPDSISTLLVQCTFYSNRTLRWANFALGWTSDNHWRWKRGPQGSICTTIAEAETTYMDLVNALYAQVPETKSQAERMIGWFFSAFFSFVVSSLRACICHYLSIYVIYIYIYYGGFQKWWYIYPKMDGVEWKILLRWMI
jgi:hypothetical protein